MRSIQDFHSFFLVLVLLPLSLPPLLSFVHSLTQNVTGGSLGWKQKGTLDPEFERVAFALEASTTGKPQIGEAKTPFGYHIIMVEGKK